MIKFALTVLATEAAVLASAQTGVHQKPLFPNNPIKNVIRSKPMNELIQGQIRIKFTPATAAAYSVERPVGNLAHALLRGEATELNDLTFVSQIAHTGWTLWSVPANTDPRQLAKELKAESPDIICAEPVSKVYPLLVAPNDPDFNYIETSTDYILDFGSSSTDSFRRLWHFDDTDVFAGWSIYPNQYYTASTIPSSRPTIAFVDTGIDPNHPDFKNAGATSTSIVNGGQIDFTRSGPVVLGQMYPGQSVTDGIGHGTHVAGLAVAAANNGGVTYNDGVEGTDTSGTLGIGYNCEAMIIQAVAANGTGTDTDAAAGMFYAADNGADIINVSLGDTNYSQIFQDAVTYAFQKGCLVVCAGNENGSGGGNLGPIYPAACSGALAVEANAPGEVPATDYYAGIGNYVDISAPGGDVITDNATYEIIQYVWSTVPTYTTSLFQESQDGQIYPYFFYDYTYLAGTSMATPIVSGAAGLYYGMHGYRQSQGYVNLQTYRALEASADDIMGAPYGGWETYQGYGSLDIHTLMAGTTTRGAQVGAVKGIVYANSTPTSNVAVTARNVNGGIPYTTTTAADGTYRFEGMPAGTYNITAAPFGLVKTKTANVKLGSDLPGFDFWCGTYTGDTTPPTVPFFNVASNTSTSFALHQWGYDTETGIDSINVQVGTTPGGSDVMPSTLLLPESNTSTFSGLNLSSPGTYYVTGTYTDGAGLVTTATTTFTVGSVITPSSITVYRGHQISGNVASLSAVDSNYLILQRGPVLNNAESPITLYVQGTAASASPTSMTVKVVTGANTTGLTQEVDAYNYTTGTWTMLDTRASSTSQGTITVSVTNPAQYVQSGTKAVQVRIMYKQAGAVLYSSWESKTDMVGWTLAP